MNISNEPRNHNYSRPLDVHLTCNHPEITELVKVIFDKYFDTNKFIFVINNKDKILTDFFLLTQCRYFIVGPSTFHWWGAWLSNFDDKICVRPKNLNPSNNRDFWPEKWVTI